MAKTNYAEEIRDVDTWWEQILFWRSHFDVFLMDVMRVTLKDTQQVIARACSGKTKIDLVKNRGYGKSWLIGWIAIAICILYPNSPVVIVSATAQQATIILKKIQSFIEIYPTLLPNIKIVGREPVVISKDHGSVYFKNGSSIIAGSLSSVVGLRAKCVIVDEVARTDALDVLRSATPLLNYTRDFCLQKGYDDYDGKLINITSACLKSNYFYEDFVDTLEEMRKGNPNSFACALNYQSAIRVGITKQEFFDERRKELPESVFDTEYNSIFIGEEANSVYPYELTASVRKVKRVEYMMPKGSKAWYVMGVDLATSTAKNSDNAVITVLKCTDREDGTILKQLVYIRSYNGRRLDDLAEEIRETYVRFPNTERIIFDHRGLGDSFPLFFNTPWVDPETEKEYAPWCLDDEISHTAEPMLHSFKANLQLNQELVTALRVALEQKTLTLPIDSRTLESEGIGSVTPLRKEEKAIYIETDALQVEMGNLVMKVSGSTGNVTYDTAKNTQHKDRYSSLAMAVWYVAQIEAENKKMIAQRSRGESCVGVVSYFDEDTLYY